MRLNAKCKKSEPIIDHCIFIRRVYNPRYKYAYRRYNMFDKAIAHKKCNIYKKAPFLYYADNILQKACYNPRILYRNSSINNMFEKANPNVALINPVH